MKKKKIVLAVLTTLMIAMVSGCQKKPEESITETETETQKNTEEERLDPTTSPTPIPTSTPKPTPTFVPDTDPPEVITEQNTGGEDETTEFESENAIDIVDQTEYADCIFIGDGRFFALQSVADMTDEDWMCSETGDYTWMSEQVFPAIDERIGKGTKVIINLGLNDLSNAVAYAALINNKAVMWEEKGAAVYFVSVGPVSEDSYISNQEIMDFNTYMYQNLSTSFIDMYNWLVENGFETVDGQTYSELTNISIYGYLSEVLSGS